MRNEEIKTPGNAPMTGPSPNATAFQPRFINGTHVNNRSRRTRVRPCLPRSAPFLTWPPDDRIGATDVHSTESEHLRSNHFTGARGRVVERANAQCLSKRQVADAGVAFRRPSRSTRDKRDSVYFSPPPSNRFRTRSIPCFFTRDCTADLMAFLSTSCTDGFRMVPPMFTFTGIVSSPLPDPVSF